MEKKHKTCPDFFFFFNKKKGGPYKDMSAIVPYRFFSSSLLSVPLCLCAYVAVGVIVRRLLLIKGSSAMHATLGKGEGVYRKIMN